MKASSGIGVKIKIGMGVKQWPGIYSSGGTIYGTGAYRYGFNGKENDDEVKGEGNSLDFGFRVSDPRLGRFFSIDPLSAHYPMYSPYHFSSNQPLHAKELEGLESEFDLNIPASPNDVDASHWKLNTAHRNPNGLQWIDYNGNKLSFDRAQFNADGSPKPGFIGKDHWHFEDAEGNRYNTLGNVAKSYGAKETHLMPGTATSIKVKAAVTTVTVTPKVPPAEGETSGTTKPSTSNAKGKLGLGMIAIDILNITLGLATQDPDAIVNQFSGGAGVGVLKRGSLGSPGIDAALPEGNYYMITKEVTKTWTENGIQFKSITRFGQNYEGKSWNKKAKRYEGLNPVGPQHIGTETYKDGKVQKTDTGLML